VLHRALDSFADGDAERAAQVLEQDDQVDADQDVVIRAAIQDIMSHPELTSQGVDFILIAKNLERVADHATNVAEDVILATQARNVKHAAKLRE
jgi:phosphate transport system protein